MCVDVQSCYLERLHSTHADKMRSFQLLHHRKLNALLQNREIVLWNNL